MAVSTGCAAAGSATCALVIVRPSFVEKYRRIVGRVDVVTRRPAGTTIAIERRRAFLWRSRDDGRQGATPIEYGGFGAYDSTIHARTMSISIMRSIGLRR